MSTRDMSVAVLPDRPAEASSEAAVAHIATIVSITNENIPEIRLTAGGPVMAARLAMSVTRQRLELAVAERHQTVVLFEGGDRSKPLVVGFIEPVVPDMPVEADGAKPAPVIEADVDGKRVRVTAQDEIVLQCGSASITLRRNGRVIVRGTYVETHSDGTNRIKGGQVQIN